MGLSPSSFDQKHVWHPYDHPISSGATYLVKHAEGVHLELDDGIRLIDAMSSWWCVVHGYNHPEINAAVKDQLEQFSHVMFGGLTHEPAINLAKQLLEMKQGAFSQVFFSDSGSIAVEIAMKMAQQYQYSIGNQSKKKFLTIRSGYHGDTWRAMSVCDPDTGMHHLFKGSLPVEYFVNQPSIRFDSEWLDDESLNGIGELRQVLETEQDHIAAIILEPIVQGAGGMFFYHPEYLNQCRMLCDEFGVLLIFDEIATGFGRAGELFASDFCDIEADIMCLGKALTGGYMSLAATLTTDKVAQGIANKEPGVLMHGPTFMANPLSCAAANASLRLLSSGKWRKQVKQIESQFRAELQEAQDLDNVKHVRTLGSIGVIEMNHVVNTNQAHGLCHQMGVWLRPFGKCIYAMPPYIVTSQQLTKITRAMIEMAKIL